MAAGARRALQELALEPSRHIGTGPYFDLRWLLLALALHAPLMLVTIERGVDSSRTPHLPVLEVSLLQRTVPPDVPERNAPWPKAMAPDRAEPTASASTAASTVRVPAPTRPDPPETPRKAETAAAAPTFSTATLLHAARAMRHDDERMQETQPLGLVQRGSRPVATGDNTSFARVAAGVHLPAVPTIRDRWLAGDGSHQVMVALPNGDIVCGRAEAWDPMRPLIEHVMLFRTCGREQTFTMPADARPAYTMPE